MRMVVKGVKMSLLLGNPTSRGVFFLEAKVGDLALRFSYGFPL